MPNAASRTPAPVAGLQKGIDVCLSQATAVVEKYRWIPYRLIDVHLHESVKQQVVVELRY